MTIQIKKKLEEEIRVLEHELKNDLPKELKKAAALGDLSENAEYQTAKQRQEIVNAKLAHHRADRNFGRFSRRDLFLVIGPNRCIARRLMFNGCPNRDGCGLI